MPARYVHVLNAMCAITPDVQPLEIEIGSLLYANRARRRIGARAGGELPARAGRPCQLCHQYATKRYRTNLINWGMLPFRLEGDPSFEVGDWLYVPGAVIAGAGAIDAYVIRGDARWGRSSCCSTS